MQVIRREESFPTKNLFKEKEDPDASSLNSIAPFFNKNKVERNCET